MYKPTRRKAFNFLRSYFDVLNELETDSDKLSFLTAILNKQFLNENPIDLDFIPKLCYESQRHQIEKSVNGWLLVNKGINITAPITDPITAPPSPIGSDPKEEEEKEEVQEKEEEKVKDGKLPFDIFWNTYNKKIGSKKSCAKKWDKLSLELQNEILDHVEAYVISTPDKQYRCNPETYFNQERWTNEIILKDENRSNNTKGVSPTELAGTFGKHFATDRG